MAKGRKVGTTSFVSIPLDTLKSEVEAGCIPSEIVVSKTWWTKCQIAKIGAGGVIGITKAVASATPAGAEELKEDDTPLEIV